MHSERVCGTAEPRVATHKVMLRRNKCVVLGIIGGQRQPRHPAFRHRETRHPARRPEPPPPGHIDVWPRKRTPIGASSPNFIHTYLAYSHAAAKAIASGLQVHGEVQIVEFF